MLMFKEFSEIDDSSIISLYRLEHAIFNLEM